MVSCYFTYMWYTSAQGKIKTAIRIVTLISPTLLLLYSPISSCRWMIVVSYMSLTLTTGVSELVPILAMDGIDTSAFGNSCPSFICQLVRAWKHPTTGRSTYPGLSLLASPFQFPHTSLPSHAVCGVSAIPTGGLHPICCDFRHHCLPSSRLFCSNARVAAAGPLDSTAALRALTEPGKSEFATALFRLLPACQYILVDTNDTNEPAAFIDSQVRPTVKAADRESSARLSGLEHPRRHAS
jgi:hypothetical protein